MNDLAKISCVLGTTDPAGFLGFTVWLDDQQLFDTEHVYADCLLEWKIDNSEGHHELRFAMKYKTVDHTQLDSSGNIIKDSALTVSNIKFNNVDLGQVFINLAEYTHNFNGTQETITEKFYGEMGCNGTVSLKFSTPIHIWLLENM
jgi:hypothetical protein